MKMNKTNLSEQKALIILTALCVELKMNFSAIYLKKKITIILIQIIKEET